MDYGEKLRHEVRREIAYHNKNGKRFSLTFDEWTSIKNRRYMNINVHVQQQFWNLGITRLEGSMPAVKCVEILEKKT